MNPSHRDGWPPVPAGVSVPGPAQADQGAGQAPRPLGPYGSNNANSQGPPHASPAQGPGPVLPPPAGGGYYAASASTVHNQSLPALPGLTAQAPHSSPHQSAQRAPSSEAGAQGLQGPPAPSYSLPGISQTLQQQQNSQHQRMPSMEQANTDRERERRDRESRDQEMIEAHAMQNHAQQDEIVKREVEQRQQDIHERQQRDQAPLQTHSAPMQIHQPVAVAPSTRTIHGPNGLLGQAGPLNGPNPLAPPMGGPAPAAGPMYGNAPQHEQTTPRMQHAVQAPSQAQMLIPFAGPPGAIGMGQGQQPILNDALSYLDQVKVQFADHPDVYNRFLDIMKDFKSGAIDTPGVIERVSTLFAGNPNLIQGFNTFLPPGYKIECGTNGDPNAIRVTTPMGTMVSTMPAPRPLSAARNNAVNGNTAPQNESTYYETTQGRAWPQPHRAPGSEGQEPMFSPNNRNLGQPMYGIQQGQQNQPPHSPEVNTRPHPDSASSAVILAHQQEQRGVSQLQNAVSAATGRSILSPSMEVAAPLHVQALNGVIQVAPLGGVAAEKRGPVEFNHAISYVNKIKNRFASQPDIYKQFLEILQTYQRESKPIQDVYAQVTTLFGGAPDLLEDFKQFLPEPAAQHRAQQAARSAAEDAIMLSNVRGESGYGVTPTQQTPRADTSRLPPMGNFAPTPTANRDNKRKRERQGPVAAPMPAPMTQEPPTASARSGFAQNNANKRTKTGHATKQAVTDGPPVSPTLTPALPEPMPPTNTTSPTQDELAFFDRVKKYIGNKNTMNEFLKLCNLFSQDLIDKQLLIARAHAFIGGNPELFTWFRKFMGEDDEQLKSRPKTVNSRVSLSNCRSLGPSYRLLPKRERERVCSGRDELCRSVLNDEWASHPTWASEDSGFVAHRKNTFEEGLHRIEEERHDYDFNIEACNRTIQQLEPIANQLLNMKPEERATFTLAVGLGGQSETIYKRVIMKIYGRDKGKDVIKELFAMPWSVVPVLLHRLKTKLEDWKAAQREWEKVWRDQTQKIFWKSLDHQSITAKQTDKRQFQPKSLTNEIQVRYEEQKRLQSIQEIPQPDYQFSFKFKDEDVLFDVARLMLTFADNNNGADFSKVVPFIKEFIPLFFGIDAHKFEQRVHTSGQNTPNDSGEDTPSPEDDVSQRSQKLKKGDLRRDVLDPRGKSRKDKDDSVASASRDTTPDIASGVEDEANGESSNSNSRDERPSSHWVEYSAMPNAFGDKELQHEEPYKRTEYNMYANASIYCFFRMFVLLYERLLKLKENEEDVQRVVARAKEPKAAQRLKMLDKQPEDFFKDTSASANYYQQVLDMFQDQIIGEMDMNFIEETLRRYYLQIGWQLYSFDRLLSSLVRFALAVVSHDNKDKSLDIYNLFRKDRLNDTTTHKNEISYRKAVEKYAKDADTYRITYDPVIKESFVRLFKKDDPTFEFNTVDRVKRWRAYVASYMAVEPTEGIDVAQIRYPYLKKRMAKVEDLSGDARFDHVKHNDKITVTISPAAYTMTFVHSGPFGPGGVQYFLQPDFVRAGLSESVPNPAEDYEALAKSRKERVSETLCVNTAWMKDLSGEEVDTKKAAWKKMLEEVAQISSEDVEMEEA